MSETLWTNCDKVIHQLWLANGVLPLLISLMFRRLSLLLRLRYFREKPTVSVRRDGSSHYQHLRFYPVDDNPPVTSTSNTVHFSHVVK